MGPKKWVVTQFFYFSASGSGIRRHEKGKFLFFQCYRYFFYNSLNLSNVGGVIKRERQICHCEVLVIIIIIIIIITKVCIVFLSKNTSWKPRTLTLNRAERITRLKKIPWSSIEFNVQDPNYINLKNSLLKKLFLKSWVVTLESWLLGTRRRTELSFVLGTEGYRGSPGTLEIFLNCEQSTSSNTSYMSIW